jgi:hypothetical protein
MINEKNKKSLEWEINAVLENVACLGRDAYGEYINKMTTYLMNKIHLAEIETIDASASPYFSKALEDLKDFAYDNCQPHNSDRLAEIVERL